MPLQDPIDKHTSDWLVRLRELWGAEDLDESLELALFHYLADLNIFEECGNDMWRFAGEVEGDGNIDKALRSVLEGKGQTEPGFALAHLLLEPNESIKSPESGAEAGSKTGERSIFSRSKGLPKKSSDPSTLQIVKKVGRQLESFIELEKSYLEKLPGNHTTKKDARKIYNFALSRMKQKADPLPWEQLSRRRHR